MGKASIIGGGTDGLYTIRLQYDNSRIEARLSVISNELTALIDEKLPAALQKQFESEQAMYAALDALNQYITQIKTGVIEIDPIIAGQKSADALKARTEYELDKRTYDQLFLRYNSLIKEQNRLQIKSQNTEDISAWCADLTEDLTGDIGTIEIALEKEDRSIIVLPGHVNAGSHQALYNQTRDGILTNFFNQSAHQLYTNRAYLPALAKWKPRYRTGSITSKSGDICNVALNPILSSQQNIDVNQSEILNNVPIVYMTCNGGAFEIGDGVLVAFNNDWNTPTVIGFSSNPKPCEAIITAQYSWFGLSFNNPYIYRVLEDYPSFITSSGTNHVTVYQEAGIWKQTQVISQSGDANSIVYRPYVSGKTVYLDINTSILSNISATYNYTGFNWSELTYVISTTGSLTIDLIIEDIGIFRVYDYSGSLNFERINGTTYLSFSNLNDLIAMIIGWENSHIPNYTDTLTMTGVDSGTGQPYSRHKIMDDYYGVTLDEITNGTLTFIASVGGGASPAPAYYDPGAPLDEIYNFYSDSHGNTTYTSGPQS